MALHVIYIDESGVPERHPSQTSHYALAGVSIPLETWHAKNQQIEALRVHHGLEHAEIHSAFLIKLYPEQKQIPDFVNLTWDQRRNEVERIRAGVVAAIQKGTGQAKRYKQVTQDYRRTKPFVHLTLTERVEVVREMADLIGSWNDVVLFGEVADKRIRTNPIPLDESAYEQVLTRYEAFVKRRREPGIVAYDLNEIVVERFTSLMAVFQQRGGLWRRFKWVTGHPFFVGSHVSDMIQVADVVAYGLRRFCENGETDLINRYFAKFDRLGVRLVGLRHFRGGRRCRCLICMEPR